MILFFPIHENNHKNRVPEHRRRSPVTKTVLVAKDEEEFRDMEGTQGVLQVRDGTGGTGS